MTIETSNIYVYVCRWCGKAFRSDYGQFCPHCCRFQDGKATRIGPYNGMVEKTHDVRTDTGN